MKVSFKINGKSEIVEFRLVPTKNGGFTAMAKSSKDLDTILDIISSDNVGMAVQKGLQTHIEKKLGLIINTDSNYNGAGYGFKLDMYSIIDKLK
jgi:hypothetical protein